MSGLLNRYSFARSDLEQIASLKICSRRKHSGVCLATGSAARKLRSVRINTVQSILFRQLRQLSEQRRGARSGPNGTLTGGADSPTPPVAGPRKFSSRIRLLCGALNRWLGAWYQLCERGK